MQSYTVYKHTSPSGKVYIGITAQHPTRRWRGGSGYRNNAHLAAAVKKYGWPSFTHDILATELSYEEACTLEKALIKKFDSTNPAKGYNISLGGDKTTLGYKYSAESREKISQALKGKRKGVPLSQAHREHIRQALKGKPHSEARKEMARRALGNRFNTEEAKRKQKENTPRGGAHHRAAAVICVDTGRFFSCIQEAANETGVSRSNISACCRGLQKTAGGKRWEYIKEAKP